MDLSDMELRKNGEGKGYYDRCGAEAGVPGISCIFAMLSRDEARHAEALRARRDGLPVQLGHSATLDGARLILRTLAVREFELDKFQGDLSNYLRAMDYEAASVRLYGRLALEAEQGWERELYTEIAAEDEMHFALLESMRELLESTGGGWETIGGDDAD